jgi:tetratricopeptide (TPR) repeat protein
VFAVVFVGFLPTLRSGFVDWDDTDNFLRNPHYRGLGWSNLEWMFTTLHFGHYQPLSWVTLGLDYLWSQRVYGDGMNPRAYHLTNNVLHAANAVLVYLLALRLLAYAGIVRSSGALLAAVWAALAFGVHPLRVESVAWVTERRDVLSSFFLLLTVLTYLRAHQAGQRYGLWIGLSLAAFTLSLLARAIAVTLPAILLVLDGYPLKRLGGPHGWLLRNDARRAWLEKLPFLVLALAAALVAPLAQGHASALMPLAVHPIITRVAQACYGLVFYLRKTVAPAALSPIYELHLPLDILAMRYLVPALLVALTAIALIVVRRKAPALPAAAACYAILLLPVLGLVQSGNQEVADRYSYLPSVVVMVLLGGAGLQMWRRAGGARPLRARVVLLAFGALPVLSVLTWRQCGVWRSTAALWTHAARVCPDSSLALNSYGYVLMDSGRLNEAVAFFRESLRIQPANDKANYNLWTALSKLNRNDEMVQACRDALRRMPNWSRAHGVLAEGLVRQGKLGEAEQHYLRALDLDPDYARAHLGFASLLQGRGDEEGALRHVQMAVKSDPTNVDARRQVAWLLYRRGRGAEALSELQQLLRIRPQDVQAMQLLGRIRQEQRSNP